MRIVEDMLAYDGELRPVRPSELHDWTDGKWVLNPAKQSAAFEKAKGDTLLAIDQFHAETIQKLVGNPSQAEKDTWALKLEVANALTNKTPLSLAAQAFLSGADLTSETAQSAWAAAVLAKSAAYARVVGLAEKLRASARNAVQAATDEATLKLVLEAQRSALAVVSLTQSS